MLKNRLLKLLPVLLALLLVFTVSVFAAFAEPEDESSDVTTEETSSDETSAEESSEASDETSSEATSSEETSSEATSSETTSSETTSSGESTQAPAEDDDDSGEQAPSNIPWKLIITVAVILVIVALLFILAKTNTKFGQKIAKFFKDYKSEIGKISWMSRKDLLRSTLVVLAVLIVAAVVIGLLDFGFSALVRLLSSIG